MHLPPNKSMRLDENDEANLVAYVSYVADT